MLHLDLRKLLPQMRNIIITCFIFANFGLITQSWSQEHVNHTGEIQSSEDRHSGHKKHLISVSINHTVIFAGIKNGSASNLTLPSFGLNYTYVFNKKWALGLHNDIILEDFLVKETTTDAKSFSSDEENEEIKFIERGNPISAAIMMIYKPWPFLGVMAGAGREFSSHEDFTVIRLGLETPVHLPKNWEIYGVLTYDINIDAYESLTYGIGIGKLF